MRIPLKPWHDEMVRGSAKTRRIAANLEREENVPDSVTGSVFGEIRRRFVPGTQPLTEYVAALGHITESALAGPIADISNDTFTRFTPLARIADQPEAVRRGLSFGLLRSSPDKLGSLSPIRLGDIRDIVWVSLQDGVQKDLASGVPITKVVDRMGMTDRLNVPIVQITYSTIDAPPPIKVPTTFDAADCELFQPSPKDATRGMTAAVSGRGTGYPEFVHRGCYVVRPTMKLHEPTPASS